MTDGTAPDMFGWTTEQYVQWSEQNNPKKFNPSWCPKHWAPCPTQGKPGMVATIILMIENFGLMPPNVRTPSAMNSWIANQTEPVCCKLGDKKMDWLWEFITEEKCYVQAPQKGRHSCFFEPGHEGPHDFERPDIKTIFHEAYGFKE